MRKNSKKTYAAVAEDAEEGVREEEDGEDAHEDDVPLNELNE